MAEAVKVAVRVRPFNDREKNLKSQLIIGMEGQTTLISNPDFPTKEPRKFAFDYSYWSHDGYKVEEDGFLAQETPGNKYVDQNKVFADLGLNCLNNAWEGYNTTLFAYGQTGSGKSYSVVGYPENKGIVPKLCDKLFAQIKEKEFEPNYDKENDDYDVQLSMIEIYNEQVKDLLNLKSFKKGGLKVAQRPGQGFIVPDLKIRGVSSYADIDSLIVEGTKARTIASTNMNASSSRAHTIVTIYFKQKRNVNGKSMTKTSIINLVDLAGSERAESTGATGARLKEGAAINQSLSCLGNCIKALADQSSGKAKNKIVVPYRDSKLTMLLKNALGGNSKTVMVAALSPAHVNYDETLSTLKYADRAKAIKTKAVVNESPTDKLIRELREEIAALKKGGMVAGGDDSLSKEEKEEMEALKRQIEQNEKEMQRMRQTWEEKLTSSNAEAEERLKLEKEKRELKKTTPHFWNLNEDPALTGMVIHLLYPVSKPSKIGSKDDVEIQLQGLNILPEHAQVVNSENKTLKIIPLNDSQVVVNGKLITQETELFHNDRILFGSSHLYALHHPQDAFQRKQNNKEEIPVPTFNDAQKEIAKEKGFDMSMEGKSENDIKLQEDLIEVIPMVNEVNAMSEELDKKAFFEIFLLSPQARGENEDDRTLVFVKFCNLIDQTEFYWSKEFFIDKKFSMQEMYQNYQFNPEDLSSWDLPKTEDPFYEDPEKTLVHVGSFQIYLENLAYKVDMDDQLAITNYKGQSVGQADVSIVPLDSNGKYIKDDYVEDPKELLGKELNFEVQIKSLKGLPHRFKNCLVKYKFDKEDFTSKVSKDSHTNFSLNFKNNINWKNVEDGQLKYLLENSVFTKIMANQRVIEKDRKIRENTHTRDLMRDRDRGYTIRSERKSTVSHQGSLITPDVSNNKELVSVNKQLTSKLDLMSTLVDKAKSQKKVTLPLDLVDKILNDEKVKIPKKLDDDKVKTVYKEKVVERNNSNGPRSSSSHSSHATSSSKQGSKACLIM